MLTLIYFTARSNLIPYAFVWEKVKLMDFSETIVVCDIKVGRISLLDQYMNHYEYQRSRSFSWTLSKVTQIQHFQSSFAQKPLGGLNPNFLWSLLEMWGWKFVQMFQVTWPCPYKLWWKTSKIFFFGTKRPMTLKLGIQHQVLEYY